MQNLIFKRLRGNTCSVYENLIQYKQTLRLLYLKCYQLILESLLTALLQGENKRHKVQVQ